MFLGSIERDHKMFLTTKKNFTGSDVFIVNFEHISHLFLVLLLLTLSK